MLAVELLAELVRDGTLTPSVPIERTITYHDPCRLNKRKGIWEEPREILRAIPDSTSGTSTASPSGRTARARARACRSRSRSSPPRSADRRLAQAAELEVDTLVSACPWSERPLSAAGEPRDIDVVDIHELLAESLGIEVGGSRRGAS